MGKVFDRERFHGYLIKGNAADAVQYLAEFPEQAELYRNYLSVFEKEEYPVLETDRSLNELLLIYRQYYRDVFYLHLDAEQAEQIMKGKFARLFGIDDLSVPFGEMEESQISEAFEKKEYHFLGGRTGGYWGPYIWKTTESKTYEVELPDGVQPYSVRFLDGFLSKSWLDFISFGEISTGGWTDGDGIIHCVKSSYDPEGENFKVSLLKHEAQHAMDLSAYQHMSSEDLEYRAKLVELIYSKERNLLRQFSFEADSSQESNGHSLAAGRIIEGFTKRFCLNSEQLSTLSTAEIQAAAKDLFAESNAEVKAKYGQS